MLACSWVVGVAGAVEGEVAQARQLPCMRMNQVIGSD
jgi:hypothetical protein